MKILIEESTLRQTLDALVMTISFQNAVTIDGYAEHSSVMNGPDADWTKVRKAITALRSALDAAEQAEPVAWMLEEADGQQWVEVLRINQAYDIPLYTAPTTTDSELREQLAVLQINNTKFLEICLGNEKLKEQLATVTKERDKATREREFAVAEAIRRMDGSCVRELAELRAAAQAVVDYDGVKDDWLEVIDRLREALK